MHPYQAVMRGPEVEPARVTKPGGQIGRPHDVGEQHRCQDAVLCRCWTSPSYELLDLVENGLGVHQGRISGRLRS
jgi:hypothetical protein